VIKTAGGTRDQGLACNFFTVSGAVNKSFFSVSGRFLGVVSGTVFCALASIEVMQSITINNFFKERRLVLVQLVVKLLTT
jgi:hypothetical protein